jgi:transposase
MKNLRKYHQEEEFQYFSMESLVPDNHILRHINKYVDFSFIDELVDHTYSDYTGRYCINPQIIVRIMLLGYLYNLSERKLFDELEMHAGFRWFCGISFSEKIPDRTTFNKIKNHRWARDGIFENILQDIVLQCVNAGFVSGKHIAVDGTQIRANASIKSFEPIVVNVTVDEYLKTLDIEKDKKKSKDKSNNPQDKDFRGEKLSNKTHRSTTDPDARLYKKSKEKESSPSYIGNVAIDTQSRVILETEAIQPGVSDEKDAAQNMLNKLKKTDISKNIQTLTADSHYGSSKFIADVMEMGITPHIPLLSKKEREPLPTWKTKTNIPEHKKKRDEKIRLAQARNNARDLSETKEYKHSQKLRKHIEHTFAEAKVCHGLSRAKSRGVRAVNLQLILTAVVQNIKRLVKFLSKKSKNAAVLPSKNGFLRPVAPVMAIINNFLCAVVTFNQNFFVVPLK